MSGDQIFEQWHRVIKRGDLPAARALVESGCDVNIRNRFGWTLLMLAAIEGDTPLVDYLLSRGADVNATNDFGVSALAYAALKGKYKAIQMLLGSGASVEVRPHGRSLLEFAGWGDGRDRTDRHFDLLREAGAV
jgi:ankyrin repeat protein